jgi:hypothetical protein
MAHHRRRPPPLVVDATAHARRPARRYLTSPTQIRRQDLRRARETLDRRRLCPADSSDGGAGEKTPSVARVWGLGSPPSRPWRERHKGGSVLFLLNIERSVCITIESYKATFIVTIESYNRSSPHVFWPRHDDVSEKILGQCSCEQNMVS